MLTVEVYRLWQNGTWDKVPVEIEEIENVDILESRAVTKAWMDLHGEKEKPIQIGLYMLSIYGVP